MILLAISSNLFVSETRPDPLRSCELCYPKRFQKPILPVNSYISLVKTVSDLKHFSMPKGSMISSKIMEARSILSLGLYYISVIVRSFGKQKKNIIENSKE